MSSARDLIGRAHRLLGLTVSGDALPEAALQDGLTSLNTLVGTWQTEKLNVYAFVDTAFTLSIADGSYTVGPSGNFALTPRPTALEDIYIRDGDVDYPVQLVDNARWNSIADKTSQSDLVLLANYEPTMTTGTLLVWPVPSAAKSLHIVTRTTVVTFTALSTELSLPQGYERALAYNLAVDLAPEHRVDVPVAVSVVAVESKAAIQRANKRSMIAYTELGQMNGRRSDINSGGYLM